MILRERRGLVQWQAMHTESETVSHTENKMSDNNYQTYYVPAQSRWPIVGAIALFFLAFGAGTLMNDIRTGEPGFGKWMIYIGLAIVLYFVWGWFKDQINESMSGLFSHQLGLSYRQGMMWFIGGIIVVVSSLILDNQLNFILFIIITGIITLIPIVYSYLIFNKIKKMA